MAVVLQAVVFTCANGFNMYASDTLIDVEIIEPVNPPFTVL